MNARIATVLLLAAIAGCDKKESGSTTENPGPANPAVQPGPTMNDTATPRTDTGMMKNDTSATGSPATTGPPAMDRMKSMSSDAASGMNGMSANLSDQAQKYCDQISGYIKDKKFDMADSSMAKLSALKDKLPAEWQTKIDSLQQSLMNAKKM